MSLFNSLYTSGPNGFWIFLLVTIAMGASTAYVSGKAIAETWRPFWHALFYALLIGCAVRFIHFALFEERLLSLGNYIIDCIVLFVATAAGYSVTRRRQLIEQYGGLSPSSKGAQ